MLDFTNFSNKSKCYNALNALAVGKMKNEMGGIAIEEFVGLNSKIYSTLVSDSSKQKKQKL